MYRFREKTFSLLLKKQLAAKKASLQQVAATLLVAAATSNLAGVSASPMGCYMRNFIQICAILFEIH